MKFNVHILSIAVSILIGCASENNEIDIKGDSISTLKDTSITKVNIPVISAENDSQEDDMSQIIDDFGPTIRKYSKRYGFDWRLILAVIKKESGFVLKAESHRGAFGLMQIMPETARTLANELNLEEVISPRNNIAAGIYYLWKLYDNYEFADENNRIKLALAAYNCGSGRISDAQAITRFQGGNPNDWDDVSEGLKLLSKDFLDLHKKVFNSTRPSSGYFTNWEQPISYVRTVLKYYDNLKIKLAFNFEQGV